MQEIGTYLRVGHLAQLGDAMLAVYDDAPTPDPLVLLTQHVQSLESRVRTLEARTWAARWRRGVWRVRGWLARWRRR